MTAVDSRRSKYCAGVGETEGDDPTVVVLELPEDVAGTEPAGDEQDQLLRQWPLGTDHTGVGQQIRQGGRVRIGPAPQRPAGVDHRPGMIVVSGGPDQVGPRGGVPLAGGGHPDPDAGFELLLRSHIETFRPQPDARLHASKRRRGRTGRCAHRLAVLEAPEVPFAPASPSRVETRSGSSASDPPYLED